MCGKEIEEYGIEAEEWWDSPGGVSGKIPSGACEQPESSRRVEQKKRT